LRWDDGEYTEPDEYVYQPPPSVWQRIFGVFSRDSRLYDLNWAVKAYPNAPANYVLRGELLLRQGDLFGAIADFRRGYELAAAGVENEAWGVVAQSLQDRSLAGLRDALYRAARYNLDVKELGS
jgi:hypothetical protein